jgi:hypothetical protein
MSKPAQKNEKPATEEVLEKVRVDSSVLMRIVKHTGEGKTEGSGILYGTNEGWFVEVTDCQPSPVFEEGTSEYRNNEYEELVSQHNAEFNLPSTRVGWYMISSGDAYLSLDHFIHNIQLYERGLSPIFLVYDSLRASSGSECPFRAFKIHDHWLMNVYRDEHSQLTIDPAR